MSRYIDADNLIKKMQEQYNDLLNKDGHYWQKTTLPAIRPRTANERLL